MFLSQGGSSPAVRGREGLNSLPCRVCAVPDTPHIDVAKCSRSTSSVVLVLDAPNQDTDVVDGYRVFYSIDQDRSLDAWVK